MEYISKFLSEKDRRDVVLKKVLELSHDDSEGNRRVSISVRYFLIFKLLSKMVELFGKDLCD